MKELKKFIILWSTQALSSLGSSMTSFALTLWLYEKTGSALQTALLSKIISQPVVTPIIPTEPIVNPEPGQPSVIPDTNRDIAPYAVQDPRKTGLIVTAAVLGAVGTGILVGGLISNAQDDDAQQVSGNASVLEQDVNNLLEKANGTLGFVDGNMIRLMRLQTSTGSYAPILNIGGKAVVVVDYRGHALPFYVNTNTSSWAPLLGIGDVGGWFNVYPSADKTDIVYINVLVSMLNEQLTPGLVAQFVKANSLGLAFPAPGLEAYKTINSEFPNGVIQTFSGEFTSAEQTLYNNNYNKMKNLF